MNSLRFYNFGNEQSYHFFKWVREGGAVDADDLIRRALEGVEDDANFREGEEVCRAAKRVLAELLWEVMEETTGYRDLAGIGDVGPLPEDLTGPILRDTLSYVNVGRVAQALLIAAGKWNPEEVRPGDSWAE